MERMLTMSEGDFKSLVMKPLEVATCVCVCVFVWGRGGEGSPRASS